MTTTFKKILAVLLVSLTLGSAVAQTVCYGSTVGFRGTMPGYGSAKVYLLWQIDEWTKDVRWIGQSFYCNINTCSYAWGQSHAVGVQYNVNFQGGLGNYANQWVFLLNANYTRTYTTTTTFTWTINLVAGQTAAPAQFVYRFRHGGRIHDGWYRGNPCGGRGGSYTSYWYSRHLGYNAVWQSSEIRTVNGSNDAIGVYMVNGQI